MENTTTSITIAANPLLEDKYKIDYSARKQIESSGEKSVKLCISLLDPSENDNQQLSSTSSSSKIKVIGEMFEVFVRLENLELQGMLNLVLIADDCAAQDDGLLAVDSSLNIGELLPVGPNSSKVVSCRFIALKSGVLEVPNFVLFDVIRQQWVGVEQDDERKRLKVIIENK